MRKLFIFIVGMLVILSSGLGLAAATTNQLINLYKAPKSPEVIKQLPPNARLVPIYQRGNWVKVGNPSDGQVGWINLVQYQKVRASYYRPDIQTVYVHVDAKGKGKPALSIVAYKNGKPMSQADALKLYKRLRHDQESQYRNMQRFSLSMQQMMDQDFLNAQRFFDSAWMNPPWMEPVILVPARKPIKPNPQGSPAGTEA